MAHRFFLACGIILGSILPAGLAVGDPIQWKVSDGGNGHSYQIILNSGGWAASKSDAEARGGYLATITSQAEQTFIVNSVLPSQPNGSDQFDSWGWWLGGYKPHDTSDWNWLSNEPWFYTTWAPSQPSEPTTSSDDVSLGMFSYDGTAWFGQSYFGNWDDVKQTDAWLFSGYILEENSVPEPTSIAIIALGGLSLLTRRLQSTTLRNHPKSEPRP